MSTATIPIANFTAGEWSPRLYGRVDIQKYGQACSELVNMTLMPHGPVTRRMGTEYVGEIGSSSVRLIEFIFNAEQAYIMEFTPGKIRFYRDGGVVLNDAAAAPYEIPNPWTWNEIRALAYAQAADVMYLCCGSKSPRKLSRTGVDRFTLTVPAFTGKPAEWTDTSGPAAVAFFQQRLWFGGVPGVPQKIWASKTGVFETFSTGTTDDAGMAFSLVSEQVNAIRWLLSRKTLVAGTVGGEWVITSGSDAAITAKNIAATLNSNYGCAGVRPLVVGAASVHVSADRRRLMSFYYEFGADSYVSQELSLLAEHLTRAGIEQTANCQNPDGIIWCAMADGSMAGCTWLKDHEVVGWHRFETAGKVRSVCCIPAAGHTETWLAVERAGGVFMERMAAPWDGETTNDAKCFYVDCGLVYEGQPATRISGLTHLEGQRVNVLADGAEHPPARVSGGAIELGYAASLVVVGLPYEWRVAPMRLEGFSPRGTVQGKKVFVTRATVRLYKTLGVNWVRPGIPGDYPVTFRESAGAMDAAPLPYSGDIELPLPGGWHEDSRVRLFSGGAFPATLTMIIPAATVNA